MQRHELDVREVLGKVIPGEEADDGVAEGLVSGVDCTSDEGMRNVASRGMRFRSEMRTNDWEGARLTSHSYARVVVASAILPCASCS